MGGVVGSISDDGIDVGPVKGGDGLAVGDLDGGHDGKAFPLINKQMIYVYIRNKILMSLIISHMCFT